MGWAELRYRPHLARYGDAEILVVVRDRDLSNAQESGMEPDWFYREVAARTQGCTIPPLVTTCTDGENGGWFRNTNVAANFWGAFYHPLLARARTDPLAIRPTFITEYLERYGVEGEVQVATGAWNTGWHDGRDFTQWTGSERQQQAFGHLGELSRQLHEARAALGTPDPADSGSQTLLDQALGRLLRAETSCNFYWGEAWVGRAEMDLDAATVALDQARAIMNVESGQSS
jgi:alpha-amylase/alpha-mannosidase (GH57 family)